MASSPELTVSTLCPSLRSAISSSSRIERSSSHTKTLAIHSLRYGHRGPYSLFSGAQGPRRGLSLWNLDDKLGAFSRRRQRIHPSSVRLYDLIDEGQSQTCAALKIGLKGLKNLRSEERRVGKECRD